MNDKMTQRRHLDQIRADAERLTKRRLEDDGFEPHYPNGYRKDAGVDAFTQDEQVGANDHVLGDDAMDKVKAAREETLNDAKRDALAKAREAKAAKAEASKAEHVPGKTPDGEASTNKKESK